MLMLAQAVAFTYYHFKLFASIFCLASIGGIAAALRRDKVVTKHDYISAALNSGLFGVIVGLMGFKFWGEDHLFFLIGFSALAGFGGTTLIDFAFQVWKRGFAAMFNQPLPPPESNEKKDNKVD